MADINVDYDIVGRLAAALRTGQQQLQEKFNQLKAGIDALIAEQFKTTAASGKLGEAQAQFTQHGLNAVESLGGMADYLDSVTQQHEDLDQDLTGGFGSLG